MMQLCRRWMTRQSLRPDLWIISDGGQVPIETPQLDGAQVVHLHNGDPGHPARNFYQNMISGLREALRRGASQVSWMEDDDWYSPDYLAHSAEQLQRADITGEARSRYYNLRLRRHRILEHARHAIIGQTSMTGSLLPWFLTFLEHHSTGRLYSDRVIWHKAPTKRRSLLPETLHHVGIKGHGPTGLCPYGHEDVKGMSPDTEWQVLTDWIGPEDAAVYRGLADEQ